MAVVWNEFKSLNLRQMRTSMRFVPPNFDQIYGYLNSIMFKKNNVDFDEVYDGKVWVCELFMNSQAQPEVITNA